MWGSYKVGADPGPSGGSLCAQENRANGSGPRADRTRSSSLVGGEVSEMEVEVSGVENRVVVVVGLGEGASSQ